MHLFQHGRADTPDIRCRHAKRQRNIRHNHLFYTLRASHRKGLQLYGKQIDQDQCNPEAWHRLPYECQKTDDIICGFIMVNRRENTKRQCNHQHKYEGGTCQLNRIRQLPCQDFRDRLPILYRISKIPVQHARQPVLVLNRQRLVQAIFRFQLTDCFRVTSCPHTFHHLLCRIRWQDIGQAKGQYR